MTASAADVQRGVNYLSYLAVRLSIQVGVSDLTLLGCDGIYIPFDRSLILDEKLEGMDRVTIFAHELGHAVIAITDPTGSAFRLKAAQTWMVAEAHRDEEMIAWEHADQLVKALDLYNDEYILRRAGAVILLEHTIELKEIANRLGVTI